MPTYTYKCTKCEHAFEKVQKMSDPPAKRCPECRSKVLRTFHPVGIVLKGSGFHKTDYRSKPQKSSGAESEGKKDTAATETKSSDKNDTSKKDSPKKTETAAKS
jgi:putative FmdB family regulatory protein